jgi:hypothetical protein
MAFDPYREWLGIEPHEQPADYYRLLGVARFEVDYHKIASAADDRMALVRSFQVGPRGVYTQKLLNELAAARVTLLTPPSRMAYDQALMQHRPPAAAAAQAAFAPMFAQQVAPYSPPPQHAGPVAAPPVLQPTAPPIAARPATVRAVAPAAGKIEAAAPETGEQPRGGRPLLLLFLGVPALVLVAVVVWGAASAYYGAAAKASAKRAAAEAAEKARRETPPPQPEPKAIVVLQEGSGAVLLTPATAGRHGDIEIGVSGTEEVLIDWTSPDAYAEWRFKLVKPGFFNAEVTYATAEGAQGAELELAIGEQQWPLSLTATGALNQFTTDVEKIVVRKSGENTITVRPGKHPEDDWLVLKSVRLVPVALPVPAETTQE